MRTKDLLTILLGISCYVQWGTIISVRGQYVASLHDTICFEHDSSCSQCLQTPNCQWCSRTKQASENTTTHHCFSVETNLNAFCDQEDIENLESNHIVTEDLPLGTTQGKHIQITPQKIKLSLRKNERYNFTLTYKQVKDYPLDLYYLIDLSDTMKKHKDRVADLGYQLTRRMTRLTTQFRLGFGSFIDKVALPFTNIHPKKIQNPCSEDHCASPYLFKNNLKLTSDDKIFTKEVKDAPTSANVDSPEGGLEALLQAMVCKEELGWKENVRKIIVFSTDSTFHHAGDGRLAGIITPNDGICHLNESQFYYYDKVHDYPSVGQISAIAEETGTNIIFAYAGEASKPKVRSLYTKLSAAVKGSYVGALGEGDEIVSLVEKVYNTITGSVELQDRSKDNEMISVKFYSRCHDVDGPLQATSKCFGVKEEQTLEFVAEVKLNDCPREVRNSNIQIGTLQDVVELDIEMLCDCKCQQENYPGRVPWSPKCNREGTLECGVCRCENGFYGNKCQCNKDRRSNANTLSDIRNCRPENATDNDPVCSGEGRCECGICICNNRQDMTGTYCQYNAANCRRPGETQVCSGNGKCIEGSCECQMGWEGRHCQCRDVNACKNSAGQLCSGHGSCDCGRCICNRDKVQYTGQFCEECPTCTASKCIEFRHCVQCRVWNSGLFGKDQCTKNCSNINPFEIPNVDSQLLEGAKLCTVLDEESGCDFNFTYKYTPENSLFGYTIYAQDSQKCPKSIDIATLVMTLMASIIVAGIITLLVWKVMVTLHDRREFARFEKNQKDGVFSTQNPIYDSPMETFVNPLSANETVY